MIKSKTMPPELGVARVALVVAVLGLYAVLRLIHDEFMGTIYESAGYLDDGIDVGQLLIGIPASVLVAAMLPLMLKGAGDLLLWLLAALVVLPSVVIVTAAELYEDVRLAALGVTVGGLAILALMNRIQPRRPLATSGLSSARYGRFLRVTVISLMVLLVVMGGVSTLSLNLSEAYDLRSSFKSASLATILQYGIAWFGAVFVPALLAWGIRQRNMLTIGLGLVATIVSYSLTGFRLVLLGPVLIAAVYGIVLLGRRLKGYTAGFVFATISGVLVAVWLWAPVALQGIVLERTVFLPGKLTAQYLSYYGTEPSTHWSYGVLKGILGPPVLEPAAAVGRKFYLLETNANANPFADGYAAFGLFGVLLSVVLLGLLMLLFRAAASQRDPAYTIPAFAMTGIYLTNVSVLTQALNGGLLALIAVVALSPTVLRDPARGPAVDRSGVRAPGLPVPAHTPAR